MWRGHSHVGVTHVWWGHSRMGDTHMWRGHSRVGLTHVWRGHLHVGITHMWRGHSHVGVTHVWRGLLMCGLLMCVGGEVHFLPRFTCSYRELHEMWHFIETLFWAIFVNCHISSRSSWNLCRSIHQNAAC